MTMFPQSYRYFLIHTIRAVATSIIYREVLLYLSIYLAYYSVINEVNVEQRLLTFPYSYYIYSYYLQQQMNMSERNVYMNMTHD